MRSDVSALPSINFIWVGPPPVITDGHLNPDTFRGPIVAVEGGISNPAKLWCLKRHEESFKETFNKYYPNSPIEIVAVEDALAEQAANQSAPIASKHAMLLQDFIEELAPASTTEKIPVRDLVTIKDGLALWVIERGGYMADCGVCQVGTSSEPFTLPMLSSPLTLPYSDREHKLSDGEHSVAPLSADAPPLASPFTIEPHPIRNIAKLECWLMHAPGGEATCQLNMVPSYIKQCGFNVDMAAGHASLKQPDQDNPYELYNITNAELNRFLKNAIEMCDASVQEADEKFKTTIENLNSSDGTKSRDTLLGELQIAEIQLKSAIQQASADLTDALSNVRSKTGMPIMGTLNTACRQLYNDKKLQQPVIPFYHQEGSKTEMTALLQTSAMAKNNDMVKLHKQYHHSHSNWDRLIKDADERLMKMRSGAERLANSARQNPNVKFASDSNVTKFFSQLTRSSAASLNVDTALDVARRARPPGQHKKS